MAGDWIKLEHTTPDKPEVVTMAGRLNIDQDAVVGKLARIWIWADLNSVSGNALTVTDAFLDRVTACPGFAGALREVGWLSGRTGLLALPNFDRHNGQTAKARAVTNRRVARHRSQGDGNSAGVTHVTLTALQEPLPEKRREEDNPPLTPKGAGGGPIGPQDGGGIPATIRQAYPESLAASPEFIKCWETEWLPYLIERKGGRMPPIMTTEKQLGTCLKLGPSKAIAGLRSAIEKGWASPDERAQPRGTGNMLADRPWDTEPDDWKAYWRDTYPPEDFPDAPRHEDEQWRDLTNDRRKTIWEGMQLQKKQRRTG